MESSVPVNEMLKNEISKVDYSLVPPDYHGDVRSKRVIQDSLAKLINNLGEQSAAAQGLNRVITSAEKLRNTPAHTLYLLKDSSAKGGQGEVTGLLKVGRKHLFLFDDHEKVCEVEPLCVLDFFVLSDRQRHGYGKRLFDYMLQDMEVSANELAVDGPSPKMEWFLKKHYGIENLIRQNNNFAVSSQFFSTVGASSKSGRSTPVVAQAFGRFAAPKPHSSIATVIHGNYHENSNGKRSGRASPLPEALHPERSLSMAPEHKPASKRPSSLQVAPAGVPAGRSLSPTGRSLLIADQLSPTARSLSPTARPPSPTARPLSPTAPPLSPNALPLSPNAPPLSPSAGITTSRRESMLTKRGFFDVKFYHNKLW